MPEKPVLHGRDHRPGGTDPIPGLTSSTANDWCLANTALGTITSGAAQPTNAPFSSIAYQTDNGSIFGVYTAGLIDSIQMFVVGTYLIRARVTFPQARTGTVQVQGVIAGHVTTYDYDVSAGTQHFTDISAGEATFEQLCVVNDVSVAAGAYLSFAQTTGSDMVGCQAYMQIFRLT